MTSKSLGRKTSARVRVGKTSSDLVEPNELFARLHGRRLTVAGRKWRILVIASATVGPALDPAGPRRAAASNPRAEACHERRGPDGRRLAVLVALEPDRRLQHPQRGVRPGATADHAEAPPGETAESRTCARRPLTARPFRRLSRPMSAWVATTAADVLQKRNKTGLSRSGIALADSPCGPYVNITFTSTLTVEDENRIAPAVLNVLAGMLDLLPIAYRIPHRHRGFAR